MTTRELIEQLQAADPSGELPVCVGNADIYFVEKLPAYYDGPLQQLVHDESKRHKQWSIVSAKLTRSGEKVKLHDFPIRDVMLDMPDLVVEVSNPNLINLVEEWRSDAKKSLEDD